jgi:biopolymer transport protein ExbD
MAKKRTFQEINAGSMADIAFLLLIFFLVTTTMVTDMGLTRQLPPDVEKTKTPPVKERNILVVLVNRDNQLLVENKNMEIAQLRENTKVFVLNSSDDPDLPARELKVFPHLGEIYVTSKHVISLRSDRGTSYQTYITVQNELAAAYAELKNEFAIERWGRPYNDLKPAYKDVLDDLFKARVSEAEPVSI